MRLETAKLTLLARDQQAISALEAAAAAEPFSADVYSEAAERAQHLGLPAAAARAELRVSQRRRSVSAALVAAAEEASAVEIEGEKT